MIFMFIILLLIGIFALAFILIAGIAVRHFDELAALDTASIPARQEKSIKKQLVTSRIARSLTTKFAGFLVVAKLISDLWSVLQNKFRDSANRIADQYRRLEWKKQWNEWRQKSRLERRGTILAMLEEADELRRAGDYTEAEKKYVALIALDPKNVNAYIGLGKTYFRSERWSDAIEAFSFVSDTLDQKSDLAAAFVGRVYKAEGKWKEAGEWFERALALDGALAKRWVDLGDCYNEMGGRAEALTAYVRALECEPNNPMILDRLIETSIISGDKRRGRVALEQMRAVNPENQKIAEWEVRINV